MRIQRLLATALATLLLSGCTSLSLSGPDILAPPKAAGRRAEIQSLIEKDSGGAYALIYPTSGSYKSGIVMIDTDADGTEEAIALYTAADGTPRILTAQEQDEHFRSTGAVKLPSANITAISFGDFNADGVKEPVVSFDGGTTHTSLKAYLSGDELTEISVADGYIDYITADFDGNSADDILLFRPSGEKAPAKGSLMIYEKDGFVEKSSCETDAAVTSYPQLRYDKISDDLKGVIADGKRPNGEYTTQLIYYDNAAKMLVNPLFLNNSYRDSARTVPVMSADIDGDGIFDIPLCSLTGHTEDEDLSAVCSRARWNNYDPEQMALAFKQDSILCEKLGFLLKSDAGVLNSVTARYTAENAVTLYALSFKDGDPVIGGELLTVKRYGKSSYDSSRTAEADLFESSNYIYTYVLSEGSPFSHDDVKNSFALTGAETIQ